MLKKTGSCEVEKIQFNISNKVSTTISSLITSKISKLDLVEATLAWPGFSKNSSTTTTVTTRSDIVQYCPNEQVNDVSATKTLVLYSVKEAFN